VVFPETLIHGASKSGTTEEPRMSIYFMFTAGHVCWRQSESRFSLKHYQAAADKLQIGDLLRPAGMAVCDELEFGNGGNTMRQPTDLSHVL
jgi:ectoine hydroxylase-related dioxygenase (phytanoyl-CoA dioxygenase family)